jgi:threonine dehydrogenase-like Zn-dependent dehydrogenase
MLQLRLHAPNDLRLDDLPAPEPGPRDAVLRVQACGICGSDLGYVQLGGLAGPGPEPMRLGHEFSAVVARVGSEVRTVEPGRRVVVNPLAGGNNIGNGGDAGAFSPEVLVRNVDSGGVLFPIPDDLPYDRAALAEPLGVGLQAIDRAAVAPGDKVVIFGAGPIGLMSLAGLRYRGFDDVVVADLSEHRLAIARELGATLAINPSTDDVWERSRALHGSKLFLDFIPTNATDAFIEASGAASVIPEIVAQAGPGARISVVALHRAPRPVDFTMVLAKQLTIAGSMAYPDDFGEVVRILGEVDLSPVISHRFPLDQASEAFEVAGDPNRAGKVVIEP